MIGNLLDKIVCEGNETIDNIMEVLPFIIIGGLWLLGAIAKTIQASKKAEQRPGQPKKPAIKRQPEDLAGFIRIVKEQYASAKQQATKAIEKPLAVQTPKPVAKPKPIYEVTTPSVQPMIEKPVVEELKPALKPASVVSEELPEIKEEHPVEPPIAAGAEITQSKYLTELAKQYANVDDLRKAILHYEILGPPVTLR